MKGVKDYLKRWRVTWRVYCRFFQKSGIFGKWAILCPVLLGNDWSWKLRISLKDSGKFLLSHKRKEVLASYIVGFWKTFRQHTLCHFVSNECGAVMILHRYLHLDTAWYCVGWCSWRYRGVGGLREYPHPPKIENHRWVPAGRMIDLTLFSNHVEYFSHSDILSLILQKKSKAFTFRKISQKIVEIVRKVTTEKKSQSMKTLSVHLFLKDLIPVELFGLCETVGWKGKITPSHTFRV